MHLCSNRPEGFGPHSSLHPSLPTTCFIDVIVEPLATWIYLLLAIPLLVLSSIVVFDSTTSKPVNPSDNNSPWPASPSHKRWRVVLWTVYAFFIVALLAMVSLEIARLVTAELGIGLLPFTYAGILLAVALHALNSVGNKSRTFKYMAKGANLLYWMMLVVVFAIKVATYVKEGVDSRNNIYPVDQYKVSDEVIDVSTMIGVAVVLAIVELVWF